MEEELKCPACRQFLREPILLQCAHSYCRPCALKAQHKISSSTSPAGNHGGGAGSSSTSDTISLCISDPDQDSDKLSVVSETDSGVGISYRASRPPSIVGSHFGMGSSKGSASSSSTSAMPSILTPSTSGYTVVCDTCHKPSFYPDEATLRTQPENIAIRRVLARLRFTSPQTKDPAAPAPAPTCQWCEENPPRPAELCCEACGYYYCSPCQTVIHPARGPLKDHVLVPASSKRLGPPPMPVADISCPRHSGESLTLYCGNCRCAVCCACMQDIKHTGHEVQSLSTAVKAQKADLGKTLQQLSEKAKHAADDIHRLKQLNEKIHGNCEDFKAGINVQVDALIDRLNERRQQLLDFADVERDQKKKTLKDQVHRCTGRLNKTTALVQFCIEVLKEPEAVVYLQIGQQLTNRVTNQEFTWHKEMRTKPEVDTEFVFSLDTKQLQTSISTLDFAQLKAPTTPQFDAAECIAENNSVTVVWHSPPNGSAIDGYILEIDSGRDDGVFKPVYTGPNNICAIDGLDFNTIYNTRVKAFNSAGESGYSHPIGLQTAPVAWFQLTKSPSLHDVILSNERATLTGASLDYRVVLGSVCFSRGSHYWEVTIDSFDGNGDVVIGVAQPSINRHAMLGKDLHGWAMYIDDQRSWFLHNDSHHGRVSGLHGGTGTVLGVHLDCDQGTLAFYVNDRKLEGDGLPYAFKNMPRGLYYPAFSVNRNAKITVHTGLVPPSLRHSSDSDDSVNDTL